MGTKTIRMFRGQTARQRREVCNLGRGRYRFSREGGPHVTEANAGGRLFDTENS